MGNICGTDVTRLPVNPNQLDLSHFELLKVVGKGGFGKVNAVQKLDTQQLFAMKRMEKAKVLAKESHLRMLWIERDIMSKLRSPFLCRLMYSFQSRTELFFVMPFMQGGDLRYHLDNRERSGMSEADCAFYAAEMLLGLQELHSLMIVYRDMKPDNILLDGDGHLRLSDFGISVQLTADKHWMTRGRAGTPGYQSPELLQNQWYGVSPDVWSYGVTIYELLHRKRPWKSLKANQDIPSTHYFDHIHFSERLSDETRDFITGLLTVDVKKRFGYRKIGWDWDRVKRHPFFRSVDWNALAHKQVKPPVKPDTERANCPGDHDLEEQFLNTAPAEVMEKDQKLFRGFSFNTKLDGTAGAPPNASLPDYHQNNNTTKTNTPLSVKVNGSGHAAAVTGTGAMPGTSGSTGTLPNGKGGAYHAGFDQKHAANGSPSGNAMQAAGTAAAGGGAAVRQIPQLNGFHTPGGGADFDPHSVGSAGRRQRLMSDDSVDGVGMLNSGGITGNEALDSPNGPNGMGPAGAGLNAPGSGDFLPGTNQSSPGSMRQQRLMPGGGGRASVVSGNGSSTLTIMSQHHAHGQAQQQHQPHSHHSHHHANGSQPSGLQVNVARLSALGSVVSGDGSSQQNSARYLAPTSGDRAGASAFTPKSGPVQPLTGLPALTGFGSPAVHSASGSGGGHRAYYHVSTPSASMQALTIGANAMASPGSTHVMSGSGAGGAGAGAGAGSGVDYKQPLPHQQHNSRPDTGGAGGGGGTPTLNSPPTNHGLSHPHHHPPSTAGAMNAGGTGRVYTRDETSEQFSPPHQAMKPDISGFATPPGFELNGAPNGAVASPQQLALAMAGSGNGGVPMVSAAAAAHPTQSNTSTPTPIAGYPMRLALTDGQSFTPPQSVDPLQPQPSHSSDIASHSSQPPAPAPAPAVATATAGGVSPAIS